jgi:hypothetical protein
VPAREHRDAVDRHLDGVVAGLHRSPGANTGQLISSDLS